MQPHVCISVYRREPAQLLSRIRSATVLTHWWRVTNICVSNLPIIGLNNGLSWVGHNQTQCRNVINWTLGNKLHYDFNLISSIFSQENAFESTICKKAPILSPPRCVYSSVIMIKTIVWERWSRVFPIAKLTWVDLWIAAMFGGMHVSDWGVFK